MNPLLFLLGCQRSGTTWLANMLDASPYSRVFMEPFSAPYGIFPEFPDASSFVESSSPELEHLLRTEMPTRLSRYKTFLLRKSLVDPLWFRLDRALARATGHLGRIGLRGLRQRARRFELLNLNRMNGEAPLFPKAAVPSLWCIKELRLAGKIPLLLTAFPDARFVVIVRHPCATVHSILTWFDRGRLTELRKDMETYLEKLELQPISKRHAELLARCREGNLAHRLALYWRVSYETMLRHLENHPSFRCVVHEELASRPREVARELWHHVGLEWTRSVDDYLEYSSGRDVDTSDPLVTVRKSATYFSSWTDEISEEIRGSVLEITSDSFLMPRFEPFYNAPRPSRNPVEASVN